MIDWTKPIRTKSGKPLQLVTRNFNPSPAGLHFENVACIATHPDGSRSVMTFGDDGCYLRDHCPSDDDAENVPEIVTFTGYINLYPGAPGCTSVYAAVHDSKLEADKYARTNRVACVGLQVEVTNGVVTRAHVT